MTSATTGPHALTRYQPKRKCNKTVKWALRPRCSAQADFLAGIWAHYADKTKGILEEGDVYEAVNAAAAVGDDRIQMKSQGYVVPDSFTHGTSEQRKGWFLKGFSTGDLIQGDTLSQAG